jgi:hypothetical protein
MADPQSESAPEPIPEARTEVPSEDRPETQTDAQVGPPPALDAGALVTTCISLLAAKAWEAMGLVANPETKKVERNLSDAQLAIDAVAALGDAIRPRLSGPERRELDTMLANLRINFVEQKSKGL